MPMAAAPEIESTEDLPAAGTGLCKKVFYQTIASAKSNPGQISREKIDVKRKPFVEQHCGSRGQLISILRSDSDRQHQQQQASERFDLCKSVKSFVFGYATQWARVLDLRIVFASHLIFWTSLLPGIAFGSWLQIETHGAVGITEVLVSACFCGLVFSFFGTQPLMIVGVSVPSMVFIVAASRTAERLSLDFLPWLGWIGLWCALLLFFLAISGACRLAAHLTRFSWEILRLFVGFSLVWIGVTEIARFFSPGHSLEASMLSLWLATCTFVMAVALSGAQSWRCLNGHARELIQNYGPALTFLVFTVLPLLPKFQRIPFERVDMPGFLFRSDKITMLGTLVRLKSVPMWAILLAFIPGALLACVIFVDHCASSVVLKYANGNVLPEKTPRSWDLFLVALLASACSVFGMPFCYGLSAQSIAHKRALIFPVNVRDEEGQQKSREIIKSQRISALIVSVLCGIPFVPGIVLLLEKIPLGVIAGMFLEMAFSCLKELKAVKRLKVFFTVSDSSSDWTFLCRRRIYCALQMVCALLIFASSRTPAALVYPIFVLLVIGFRHYVLLGVFTEWGLAALDSSLSSGGTVLEYEETAKAEVRSSFALVRSKAIEIESSSSPQSRGSPSMLIMPSSRRLKERSRRRNKRKRQTSGSAARTEDDREEVSTKSSSFAQHIPSFEDPRTGDLDPRAGHLENARSFGRSKRRALNIELHSNLLYDHGWRIPVTTLLHPDAGFEGNCTVPQSPATYESPHEPSPASSQQRNGLDHTQQHQSGVELVKASSDCGGGGGGSNSSNSSSQSRKRKPAAHLPSAGFSTTENPCFVQYRDESNVVAPATADRETTAQQD